MAQQKSNTAKKGTNTKKTTAAKKKPAASGRKKTAGSRKKQKNIFDIVAQRSFTYIIMLIVAVLLLLLTFVAGGFLTPWNKIRSFYFALFGIASFVIPFLMLFRAVMGITGRDKHAYKIKTIEIFVFAILIGAIVFVNTKADPAQSFLGAIKANNTLFFAGSTAFFVTDTGLLATFLGGLLFALGKNAVLADILLVMLMIADIMFIFKLTPQRIYTMLEGPLSQLSVLLDERRREQMEQRQQEEQEEKEAKQIKEKKKQQKEEELPAHPVRTRAKTKPQTEPSEPAPAEAKPNGRTVTVQGTKALLEEFEKESRPQKKADSPASQDVLEPIPDLFHIRDHEIADIFTIAQQAKKIPSDEPSAPSAEPVREMPTRQPQAQPPQAKEEEKIIPLSEREKEETAAELDSALEQQVEKVYVLPSVEMLTPPKQTGNVNNEMELQANGEKLIKALASFNVSATILDVVPGPSVTRYELTPAPGVKISRFVGLADDLALHLAAPSGLRIEAPIPNKSAIGIEVPNKARRTVTFREVIDTKDYRKSKSKLNVGLGKDIAGNIICSDLAKMPHILVAGTTGSGKSVCMNTMICSLLYNATPDEVKLLLIDPKQVEFSVYNGIPHLLVPVVSDPRKAAGALGWAVTEMLSRYKTLNANGVRDIGAYNQLCDEVEGLQKMPQIVIFIDELSDLMTVAPSEVEDSIQRLAQMARAAGMHLVIATQRPSVDVITGVIKANIPSRIALSVSSQVDSRTIIDSAGAEKLMGYGDMLYYPVGVPKPMRVQGAFLSDEDIENVVTYLKSQAATTYNDEVEQEIERQAVQDKKKASAQIAGGGEAADAAYEELVQKAIELFVNTPEKASTSSLQRHLRLGYSKAGSLMDALEERGIVGPIEGSKPRKVLITKAQWYEMQANQEDGAQQEQPPEPPFEPDVTEE